MTNPTQSNESREERLNELIAEFLRRVDRGEKVDPEEFIAPYPELAESFAEYLEDAAFIDGLRQSHGLTREEPPADRDTAGSPTAADETIPPGYVAQGQEQAPEARQFGRYRLVKLLGQGAMGAVYLAEDPELQRHVALKIPKFLEGEGDESWARFYREARAAATLSHPNICQVHDIGEQDGTPFITMAYIQGKALSRFTGAKRQWPERDVAKLVRKIALALTEAHEKGVVHRDLKPANIMLDQRHEPIVMDFGLAGGMTQPGEAKLTHTGMLLGTPAYMAPEQAESDFAQVGPQSDIYSLGVICYELLTGEVPFRGPVAAVIVQIVRDAPRRPSELRPSLDERLEAICLKMMAKAPGDRYRTANEVADALRNFLEETAPGRKSPPQPATDAARRWEDRKEEIVRLLQGGQFGPAIDALEELVRAEGPGAGQYAAWARGELARVRSLPQELLEKGPAIVETAIELIASQQYGEAVRLLEAVPAEYRSTEASKLLDKATKLQKEADRLNTRMHEAVHTRQYDGLQDDLARLLELQPGNLTARDLYDKLGTYAPGQPYRFGKDGRLLSAHRTPLLVLVGSSLRQALRGHAQRQKYGREPAGKRAPAPAEPAPDGPRLPILQIAIAAGALAMILLAIVVLLRDGRQTVRVEIDDKLLADESLTLRIDDREMEIAGLGETIRLKPGDHGYELRRGDEVVRSGQFAVLKGETAALEISLDECSSDGSVELQPTTTQPEQRAMEAPPDDVRPEPSRPPLAIAPFDADEGKAHQTAWADYLGVPVEKTNSLDMKMVLIPPGEFDMGSTQEEIDELLRMQRERGLTAEYSEAIAGQGPKHLVKITHPLYFGKHEITVGQFGQFVEATGYQTEAERDGKGGHGVDTVTGKWGRKPEYTWRNPGFIQQDEHPVINVARNDALAFCRWLSTTEKATFRLPTEAEWEYACRAGTNSQFSSGDDWGSLRTVANIADASLKTTNPPNKAAADSAVSWDDGYPFTASVGRFRANGFGLHDLHGNVWEFCQDRYAADYYSRSSSLDPTGPNSGEAFAIRGGSWLNFPPRCGSATRFTIEPAERATVYGFRLVCEIDAKRDLGEQAPHPEQGAGAHPDPEDALPNAETPRHAHAPQSVRLRELNAPGSGNAYAWPSGDGLTIYWTREGGNVSESEIWQATRPDATSPFENPRRILFARHAAFTENGLVTVCIGQATQSGAPLLTASRRSVDAPFPKPQVIPELADQPRPKSPWISKDGLVLVFQRAAPGGKTQFAVTTRHSPQSRWSPPQILPMRPDAKFTELLSWPHLSADGLELWFCHDGGRKNSYVARARRTRTSERFGDYQFVQVDGKRLMGRAPRYVPATGELFFSAPKFPDDGGWELRVVRNLAPGIEPRTSAEEVRLTARGNAFDDASFGCPALTSDGLEIVFHVKRPGTGNSVWMAKRSTTQEPFGEAIKLSDGSEPTIDGAGLEIVYVDHPKGARLMRRTRTSRFATFGSPQPVFSDSAGTSYVAPCLSEDGLKLLLCGGKSSDPAVCTRRSRSEAWGTPTRFNVRVPGFDRRTPAFAGTPNKLLVSVLGEEGPKHLAVVSSMDGGRTFADPQMLQFQDISGPVMTPRYCPATGEVFFQCWPEGSGSRIWKASLKGTLD